MSYLLTTDTHLIIDHIFISVLLGRCRTSRNLIQELQLVLLHGRFLLRAHLFDILKGLRSGILVLSLTDIPTVR